MPLAQAFIQNLRDVIEESALPKFWSSFQEIHSFQDALNAYAEYYKSLNPIQQKKLSQLFWDQINTLGTPIIEDGPDNKCNVYFLFPKERIVDSKENPGTKKDLYLQGDFHGYDTTEDKRTGSETYRNRVTEFNETGVMLHKDVMPKDAIVTYRYIQLEPSLRNRTPMQHHGSVAVQELPKSFFSDQTEKLEVIPPQTKNAIGEFWGNDNQLADINSRHHPSFLMGPKSTEKILRVNSDKALSRLPREKIDWPSLFSAEKAVASNRNFIYHDTLYSDQKGDLKPSEARVTDKYADDLRSEDPDSPYVNFTRAIHVFKPTSGQIENVIFVNDGIPYLITGVMENFEKMVAEGKLSPNTALVFVNPLPGLVNTLSDAEARSFADDPQAKLPGMGVRLIDYGKHGIDQYANFLADKLIPGLEKVGTPVPSDPRHRVMVGSSASGTASLYIGSKRPDLFGNIIVQSPSPSHKEILKEEVASPSKSRANSYLSCGEFEQPDYAANTNLPFARELSEKLGIPLHVEPHGHQFLAWTNELEQSIPGVLRNIESVVHSAHTFR